jgi:hypothetical protein
MSNDECGPAQSASIHCSWGRAYDPECTDHEESGFPRRDYLIETEPTVSDFLDLDGKPVSLDGFKLDHDEEMIPYELSETSPVQRDYYGYQENARLL